MNAPGPQPARIMTDGTIEVPRARRRPSPCFASVIPPRQTASRTTISRRHSLWRSPVQVRLRTFIELLLRQERIWSRRLAVQGTALSFLATRGNAWFLVFTGQDTADALGPLLFARMMLVRRRRPHISSLLVAPTSPQLLAVGQGLALVWVGEHQTLRPLGLHVAFSDDGTHWTTTSAFNPDSDSTTAAMAIAFDDRHIALTRLIGQSVIDHVESFEIVSRTARDVL